MFRTFGSLFCYEAHIASYPSWLKHIIAISKTMQCGNWSMCDAEGWPDTLHFRIIDNRIKILTLGLKPPGPIVKFNFVNFI